MTAEPKPAEEIGLRPPSQVMRLARLGAFHQTRLSFVRAMLRRVVRDGWTISKSRWEMDDKGVGFAVYAAETPEHTYSLVCFAHDLPANLRTDRVIAEAWDATFTLFDGVPTDEDIERLSGNTPKQEAGRYRASDLILSRVNRSSRLFEHVVGCLAAGRQPDPEKLDPVGYLMRTTAVYGNGKFGIADRDRYAGRPEFAGPFRAEMLTVWLIRQFVADYTEFMARVRGCEAAVPLDRNLRRRLGVGNSTGLGLGPFIVNHPALFDRWITARETALARIRSLPEATKEKWAAFLDAFRRAKADMQSWAVDDELQSEKIASLNKDLALLADGLSDTPPVGEAPWNWLYRWGEKNLGLEAQELLVSLLIEPHAELVDDLADTMAVNEQEAFRIDGSQTVGVFHAAIDDLYAWALEPDYENPAGQARFWYVSQNKLEPRLGERATEPGGELEQPLAVGRDVAALQADLAAADPDELLAEFLLRHPEHRHAARRAQISAAYPYAEIHDNLIGEDLLPLDLLRCKLAFFGATRFDPRSDRWLRINMFQHAPYPDEIDAVSADGWAWPDVQP